MKHPRRAASLSLIAAAVFAATPSSAEDCSRIVSLAPGLTEIIFALGLGPNVIGVTRYDEYPPEARKIPRVGGFLDPNIERVLSLKPSIVVAPTEGRTAIERLSGLGLGTLSCSLNTVDSIFKSLRDIGSKCGVGPNAEDAVRDIRRELDSRRVKLSRLAGRRAVVLVGGSGGGLSDMFISGRDGFYSTLFKEIGLSNAFTGTTQALASISAEGLYALDPDYIFRIVYGDGTGDASGSAPLKSVPGLAELRAVKKGRVFVLRRDYAYIPGPRMAMLADEVTELMLSAERSGDAG